MAVVIPASPSLSKSPVRRWWLFGPRADVVVFLGSALLSVLALIVGKMNGYFETDEPEWTWIAAILLVDVAHVWSTGFRVYFDMAEVRRRPALYIGVPAASWLVGMMLFSLGSMVFWRILAYLAVYHFVRQQYGWVALYRAKLGEQAGRWLDTCTIYIATLYPLLYWHAHLPRHFWWFVANDISIPEEAASALLTLVTYVVAPLYWALLFFYACSALAAWRRGTPNPGKDMVVVTTAFCWYVGIVGLNSDYAFTVTNVIIHGVPYMALVYFWQQRKAEAVPVKARPRSVGIMPYLLTLWALAYIEELFWDRAIWHEHSKWFGSPWDLPTWQVVLVPLLAVPQITHYVLDGFIWKRRTNPEINQVVLAYKQEGSL